MSEYDVSGREYDAKTIYDLRDEVKYLKETIEKLQMQVSMLRSELSNEKKYKRTLNLLAESMRNLTETD